MEPSLLDIKIYKAIITNAINFGAGLHKQIKHRAQKQQL